VVKLPRPDVARPKLPDETVRAFKAFGACNASDHQQKLVAEALLHLICRVDADCFAGDPHATAFNLGRRWPGIVVRELFTLPMASLGAETKPKQTDG
jgi:hypothetical protein